MGLDAVLKSVPVDFVRDQPVTGASLADLPSIVEVKYWRKFGELHNWFAARNLFLGGSGDFNCSNLRVFEHDIEMLLRDMKSGDMPEHGGFFFGDNDPWKRESAIEFFEGFVKTADWNRFAYYYSAWW